MDVSLPSNTGEFSRPVMAVIPQFQYCHESTKVNNDKSNQRENEKGKRKKRKKERNNGGTIAHHRTGWVPV
jgi:hypothetical protein